MGNLGLVSTQKRGDSFSPLFSLPRFVIEVGALMKETMQQFQNKSRSKFTEAVEETGQILDFHYHQN